MIVDKSKIISNSQISPYDVIIINCYENIQYPFSELIKILKNKYLLEYDGTYLNSEYDNYLFIFLKNTYTVNRYIHFVDRYFIHNNEHIKFCEERDLKLNADIFHMDDKLLIFMDKICGYIPDPKILYKPKKIIFE